jgi:4,5-dihydroxyphthalate decarboxylase
MLQLRGTFSPNPRMIPLLDGTVKPEGVEITFEQDSAGNLHERHLRDSAFDVFEFSISNYMITKEKPRALWDWTAIPIFLSKAFLGLNSLVNLDSGVKGPQDLKGKTFGIADYTMTAGVWFRAMLLELYGIRPQDINWVVTRAPEHSHGVQLGVDKDPPRDVSITWSNPQEVSRRLEAGEIHASFANELSVDASNPRLAKLFPDGGRSFVNDFVQKTGFAPVNHTVVMQRSLAEREPWLPEALFEAFERSKQEAYRRDPRAAALFRDHTDDLDWQRSAFGADPFASGLAANRPMLSMAARQSNLDGLTKQPANVDELFWETVRGT